jgi:hypothetical protein
MQKDGPKWLYNLQWFEGDIDWDQKVYSHDYIVTFEELPVLTTHHAPPIARLMAPANSSANAVQLRAEASSRDSAIAKVEFHCISGNWKNWFLEKKAQRADSTLIGDVATAPYVFDWKNVPAGFYNIIARVTDKQGATAESNVARISVGLNNLALGKTATASSKPETALKAVDGNLFTSWNGERPNGKKGAKKSDAQAEPKQDQWLAVDLGAEQNVSGVAVSWWKAYARDYRIEVSLDNQVWKEVFHEPKKSDYSGNTDVIRFPAVKARHVRLVCAQPGTDWGGYTVYELGIYEALPETPVTKK